MSQYELLYSQLREKHPQLLLKKQELLSQHTSFKVGGPCPLMAFPTSQEECISCLEVAQNLQIETIPLGNGSNLLVADQGYEAFFLNTKQFRQISHQDTTVQVSSGCTLGQVANYAHSHSLTGLEFAQGIPGTVGGAIVMNAGAYGGEMSQVASSVSSYCLQTATLHTRTLADLDFSYRHSLFSQKKELILWADLTLQQGNQEEIKEKMRQFAQQRKEKQPLDFPSCGSTFKRPQGHFAAALIDQAGLKGFQIGQAQVSPKHAGFVVNLGSGSCQDILAVIGKVKETVLAQSGISLELEVEVLQK